MIKTSDMNKAVKTPIEDLKNKALQDYDDAATKAHHWNSDIPKAIEFYYNHKASNDKQPRAKKKALRLFGVIARFLGILLFVPATIVYFALFMIANPIQYILTGNHTIAGKFHRFINDVIKQNGL